MDHFSHGCMMAAPLSGTVSPKAADIPKAVPHLAESAVIPKAVIPEAIPALISENLDEQPLELPNPHPFFVKRSDNCVHLFTLMPQHVNVPTQKKYGGCKVPMSLILDCRAEQDQFLVVRWWCSRTNSEQQQTIVDL
jgi:hypothetical protein